MGEGGKKSFFYAPMLLVKKMNDDLKVYLNIAL
jgi:hypothetical protein